MESAYTRFDARERQIIEEMINDGAPLQDIAGAINKNPTSVSREVKRNRIERKHQSTSRFMRNPCAHAKTCTVTRLCRAQGCKKLCSKCDRVFCHTRCRSFSPWVCKRIVRWPFVCNRCPRFSTCPEKRFTYDGARAHRIATSRASLSRQGLRIDVVQLERIDALVCPLLKRGQSPYHIWNNHRDELNMSLTSFYALINSGLLEVGRMHLVRAVRFKRRRKEQGIRDKRDFATRTYADYQAIMEVIADE